MRFDGGRFEIPPLEIAPFAVSLHPDDVDGRAVAAERRLWHALRHWSFARQVHVDGVGVVDFVYEFPVHVWNPRRNVAVPVETPGLRVAVELSGRHDLKRHGIAAGALAARGYVELRFTVDEVLHRFRWVLHDIAQACRRSASRLPADEADC